MGRRRSKDGGSQTKAPEAKYEGESRDGLAHGKGKLWDARGNVFEGTFEAGRKSFGQTEFANGDFHSGKYLENKRHGTGTYIFRNGDRFDGLFEHGQMHSGKLKSSNGEVYIGEFQNGVPHGEGTKTMRSGDKFVGMWRCGMAHGWGTKWFACGDMHEGNYENNIRHGYGKYKWLNGDVYEGFYENGKACGRGTFTSKDNVSHGIFKNDKLEGSGIRIHFQSGATYVGEMAANLRHGLGVIEWEDGTILAGKFEANEIVDGAKRFMSGSIYDGQWRGNVADGLGIKWFVNRDVYRGQFVDDKRHGLGAYSWADTGTQYFGYWENSAESGQGSVICSNGQLFCGSFENGVKHGNSICFAEKNGMLLTIRQVWVNGIKVEDGVLTATNFHRFNPPKEIQSEEMYISYFLGRHPRERMSCWVIEPGRPRRAASISKKAAAIAGEREPWTTDNGGDSARAVEWV